MDDKALKELWQTASTKFMQQDELHYPEPEKVQIGKVRKLISSMQPLKIVAFLFGIGWVLLWTYLLITLFFIDLEALSNSFLLSMSGQVILTASAVIIYGYQIVTIHSVANTGTVVGVQSKLARLRSTSLWVAKLLFLQLPLWTTFYWNDHMFNEWNWIQWTVQGSLTGMFTIAAVWLFANISMINRNKKWFKLIFRGKEWAPIVSSLDLLEELKEFSKEEEIAG